MKLENDTIYELKTAIENLKSEIDATHTRLDRRRQNRNREKVFILNMFHPNKKDLLRREKSASSPFSPLMSVFTPTAFNLDEHSHPFPRLDVVFKKSIWCLSLAGDRFLAGPPPLFSGGRTGPGFDSGSVLQIVVVGDFVTVVQLRCRSLCCGNLRLLQRGGGSLEFCCLARNFFIASDFNIHWETGWEALGLAAV